MVGRGRACEYAPAGRDQARRRYLADHGAARRQGNPGNPGSRRDREHAAAIRRLGKAGNRALRKDHQEREHTHRVAMDAPYGFVKLTMLVTAALLSAYAAAQDYPNRTIRIVVPFPPGGATDVVTRIVAQKLSDQMGRQVVTENRGGAGGIVGAEAVAKAAPDGYSLVMGTTGTHAINASLYSKLSYDPLKDFAPVTRAALLPNMIVAHPSVPAKNVRELIALARRNPGQLTYASSGSALYLSGALFTSMARVEMLHVPYKGGGQAMPALLGGEVALSFATVVSSLPHVKAGKLRALAVTSARRTPAAPEYP